METIILYIYVLLEQPQNIFELRVQFSSSYFQKVDVPKIIAIYSHLPYCEFKGKDQRIPAGSLFPPNLTSFHATDKDYETYLYSKSELTLQIILVIDPFGHILYFYLYTLIRCYCKLAPIHS